MQPVFAANWKMNHGPEEAAEFVRRFVAGFAPTSDRTVILFPSALAVAAAREGLRARPEIKVGVQNIHWEERGAFTGETSAPIARAAGADYALVGHSERRHVFGETDEQAGKKVAAGLRAGLTPVLCVGETAAERERGETAAVVLRQLRSGLAQAGRAGVAACLVAYEPVWAIGTGETATPRDAAEVHVAIRAELRALGGDGAVNVPILYGGSVNQENAAALLAADEVGGLLVGGASLDAERWCTIART